MKEFITKYQKAIVGTGAVSVLLICFLQQRELNKLRVDIKNLGVHIIEQHPANPDSIKHELFDKEMTIQRYEIALEMLREENPKAAEAYELILTTQTE